MSRFMIVPCIVLMLGIRMPMAAEAEVDQGSLDGAKGFGIGALVVVIRLFGGLTEGVMYAILLGNAATPLIDQLTQPRVFGAQRSGK